MNLDRLLDLRKIKTISDYQFGIDITNVLFDEESKITLERSKNTEKIRYIYYDHNLLLTLKPTNGLFTISLYAAKKIIEKMLTPRLRAVVINDISEFIKEGRNVFCKHIVNIDESLRPMDEIIVVNQNDELLAIGRVNIPVEYVKTFKKGVAINTRKGVLKELNSSS